MRYYTHVIILISRSVLKPRKVALDLLCARPSFRAQVRTKSEIGDVLRCGAICISDIVWMLAGLHCLCYLASCALVDGGFDRDSSCHVPPPQSPDVMYLRTLRFDLYNLNS